MITLYHHGSSVCAAKVRIVLAEKSLPWEGIYIDILRGDQFDPAYMKLNPKAVVPTLVHDRKVIIEFERHLRVPRRGISRPTAQARRSGAPRGDALMDQSGRRVSASGLRGTDVRILSPAYYRPFVGGKIQTVSRQHTAAFGDRRLACAQEGNRASGHGGAARRTHLPPLRQLSAEDGRHVSAPLWLAGGTYSLADIAMAPYVNRLDMLGMSEMWIGSRPRLTEWFERIKSHPSFTPSLLDVCPPDLTTDLKTFGTQSWPDVKRLLAA